LILYFIDKLRVDAVEKSQQHIVAMVTKIDTTQNLMLSAIMDLKKDDSVATVRMNHYPSNPLDVKSMTKVSSTYSYRKNPITNKPEFHAGIDYKAPKGTLVYASAEGVIIKAGWDDGFGNTVQINHDGNGYITQYSHLDAIMVKLGQRIKQGEIIGTVGSSGEATGDHLDFRITFLEKYINPQVFIPLSN